MPRQFTPVDGDVVADRAQEMNSVFDARRVGACVIVIMRSDYDRVMEFGGLVEDHGWFVGAFYPNENGDIIVFSPITDVPGGDGDE